VGPQGPVGITASYIGDEPPASPIVGQQWFESDTGQTFIWYQDPTGAPQWVPSNVAMPPPVEGGGGGGMTEEEADARYVNVTGDTLTGALVLPSGTEALPSLGIGAANTGWYSPVANVAALSVNGLIRARFSATSFITYAQNRAPLGLVGSPAYSWEADTDTGFYNVAADQLGVSTGGTLRWTWTDTAVTSTLKLNLPAGTTASASLNIPLGVAPTTPVAGDMFLASTGVLQSRHATGWHSYLTGGGYTMSGAIITSVPTAGAARFNLPHGVAPTTPNNGDMWTTTAGLFLRINGATQQVGPGWVQITQAAYDAIGTKDPNMLYVVVG
jgi:hypothetical protein